MADEQAYAPHAALLVGTMNRRLAQLDAQRRTILAGPLAEARAALADESASMAVLRARLGEMVQATEAALTVAPEGSPPDPTAER